MNVQRMPRRINQVSIIKIQQSSISRLLSLNWFSDIGNSLSESGYSLANSLMEAETYLGGPEWENVTLEESNKISAYLSVNHTVIFQDWNKLIKESKDFFEKELLAIIPHLNGFDNTLLRQCLEWDIIHYLVEDAYKENLKEPFFFEVLISIYESGHIPCGWAGKWPNGHMIVY